MYRSKAHSHIDSIVLIPSTYRSVAEGTSTLNLRLISGSSLEVQGRQLSIALCGLSQFRESFNFIDPAVHGG